MGLALARALALALALVDPYMHALGPCFHIPLAQSMRERFTQPPLTHQNPHIPTHSSNLSFTKTPPPPRMGKSYDSLSLSPSFSTQTPRKTPPLTRMAKSYDSSHHPFPPTTQTPPPPRISNLSFSTTHQNPPPPPTRMAKSYDAHPVAAIMRRDPFYRLYLEPR